MYGVICSCFPYFILVSQWMLQSIYIPLSLSHCKKLLSRTQRLFLGLSHWQDNLPSQDCKTATQVLVVTSILYSRIICFFRQFYFYVYYIILNRQLQWQIKFHMNEAVGKGYSAFTRSNTYIHFANWVKTEQHSSPNDWFVSSVWNKYFVPKRDELSAFNTGGFM